MNRKSTRSSGFLWIGFITLWFRYMYLSIRSCTRNLIGFVGVSFVPSSWLSQPSVLYSVDGVGSS